MDFRDVDLNPPGKIGLWNKTLTDEDDEEIGPWIFAVILAGAFFIVFLIIGLCILSHVFYNKLIKKPYTEKTSQSTFYIETDEEEKRKKKEAEAAQNRRHSIEIESDSSSDEEDEKNQKKPTKIKKVTVVLDPDDPAGNSNLAFDRY